MKRIKQHRNKQIKAGVFSKGFFKLFKKIYNRLNWIEKTKLNKSLKYVGK